MEIVFTIIFVLEVFPPRSLRMWLVRGGLLRHSNVIQYRMLCSCAFQFIYVRAVWVSSDGATVKHA